MSKSFEAEEVINLQYARKMYDNWDSIAHINSKHKDLEEERMKLKQYILKYEGNINDVQALIKVSYKYPKNKKGKSRQTVYGVGLQNLLRETRQTISKDIYDDIDMVNSEPTLLIGYCEKSKYKCDAVKYYKDNRDKCLKELMEKCKLTKEDAKLEILKILNGGTPKYLNMKMNFYDNINNEIKIILSKIESNQAYADILKDIKANKKSKWNYEGSLLCYIIHDIENKCLLKCIEFLKKENIDISNLILIFDGFMIPKKTQVSNNDFLKRMSEYVSNETTYNVNYIKKEMEEFIDVSKFEINHDNDEEFIKKVHTASNDDDASNILLENIKNICYCCNDTIWIKRKSNKCYTDDSHKVDLELQNIGMSLNIVKKGINPQSYSKDFAKLKKIVETTKMKLKTYDEYIDNNFYNKIIKFGIDKLFFKNGYIKFVDDGKYEVIKENPFDDSVMTTYRIPRKLPDLDNIKPETIEELKQRVFKPIFQDDEVINNFLSHMSRASACKFIDKDWLSLIGLRNSGKGVLVTLFKNALCEYVIEINSNHFIQERMKKADDAKEFSWLYDARYSRIWFTSEFIHDSDTKIKMNGTLIKSLCSGGDMRECRKNFIDPIQVKPMGRLCMMANDIPDIDPIDAIQTLSKFDMPSQFLDEIDYKKKEKEAKQKKRTLNKNIFKADPSIKDFCMREDIADCVILLLLQNYKKNKVINCKKVRHTTKELREDKKDDGALLNKYFNFTGSDNDYVLSCELSKLVNDGIFTCSLSKLKQLIKMNGGIEDKHLKNRDEKEQKRGSQRGYTCVKLNEQLNELD